MIWGSYQATNKPILLGAPGGKGVGGGVGVGVGGGVDVGAGSVAVGTRGESRGELKASTGASVPVGEGLAVAVGVAVGVGVGVELGKEGRTSETEVGEVEAPGPEVPSAGSSVGTPQLARNAANAAALAPRKNWRRLMLVLFANIGSL
jgi:hypothetical protein